MKEILSAWVNATFGRTKITGVEEKKKKSGIPYEIVISYVILPKETKGQHTEIMFFENEENLY